MAFFLLVAGASEYTRPRKVDEFIFTFKRFKKKHYLKGLKGQPSGNILCILCWLKQTFTLISMNK